MRLHTGKTGTCVLGIAESFKRTSACSKLAGIVIGILSIFTLIQTSDKGTLGEFPPWWLCWCLKAPASVVLSAAYLGVSLLRFTCFVYRRHFEALTEYYTSTWNRTV